MTESSNTSAVDHKTAASSNIQHMVDLCEEIAIHQELEETGIMEGWCEREDEESL